MKLNPKIVPPGEGRTVALVGALYTHLVTGEETGGAYALLHGRLPAGDPGPPLHTHHREDEGFYVVDGEITFTVGDRETAAPAGTFVFGPRGVPHTIRNSGAGEARVLITITPAGLEAFFDEAGVLVSSADDPAPAATPEQIQRLIDTAPKYGLELHLPTG